MPTRRQLLQSLGSAGALLILHDPAFSADHQENGFLRGNFGPVHEEVTLADLKVVGKLPADLDGLYVRNGPNPQFTPKGKYHWFDGDGMLHGVRLQGGKASYRNRYVRTAGWEQERKAGRATFTGLLERPDLVKLAQGKAHKNVANTALVQHHGKLLALWEAGEPHEIRTPGLETRGPYNFAGKLDHPFTAHPKVDAATGEMMFFGYGPIKPYVRYGVADAEGVIVHTAGIEIPRPVMMHDFAITARHTLFLDLPETFSIERLLRGESIMKFEPENGARIGVMPRRGTSVDVRWFEIAPCFVFHTLNAYDDGDEVVLHACRMKDFPEIVQSPAAMSQDPRKVPSSNALYEWRLNVKSGAKRERALHDLAVDFPRIDDRLLGRKARFGYTMKTNMQGLVKYDLEKGKEEVHDFGNRRYCGEAVFVRRADADREDDGYLLTFVHDEEKDRSELVVLDAAGFRDKPIARVLLPVRVPFGFHGTWVATKDFA